MARYLNHRDTSIQKAYKWCTNELFLNNDPALAEKIIEPELLYANPKFYYGVHPSEQYDCIILPMTQFLVRNIYAAKDNIYAEYNSLPRAGWTELDKEPDFFPDFFKRYVFSVKEKFPGASIFILAKHVPVASEKKFLYGNYSSQFSEQTLQHHDFSFLKELENVFIIDKAKIKNNLINDFGHYEVVFPWYSFDGIHNEFYKDLLHYSETFIDRLFSHVQGVIKDTKMSDTDEYFDSGGYVPKQILQKKVNWNIITNQFEKLAIKMNLAEHFEDIEALFGRDLVSIIQQAELSCKGDKEPTQKSGILNTVSFQSVISSICVKAIKENKNDNYLLQQAREYYASKLASIPTDWPIHKSYTYYFSMVDATMKGKARLKR